MNVSRSTWYKISAGILAVGLAVSVIWFWQCSSSGIVDFDDKRDTQEILKIFERDRYWLLASEDYSPEFMLKHRAPNQELKYIGRLHIKVCREKEKFVGFTAYYMKEPGYGFLLFLAVNPEFRGRGYAEKFVRYVVTDLRKMGAEYVQLCTRTDNVRAQHVYIRVGFHEVSRNNGFMYFQYDY